MIGEIEVLERNSRGMIVRIEVAVDKKLLDEAINDLKDFNKMRDAARTVRFSSVHVNNFTSEVIAEITADTSINIGAIECVFTYSGMKEAQSAHVGDTVYFRINPARLSPGKHTGILELQMEKIAPGVENVGRNITFVITKDQVSPLWFLWNGDTSWKHKWIYAGLRAGLSPRSYVLSTLDLSAEPYSSFEFAAVCEAQIISLLSLQTEIVYSRDAVRVDNPEYGTITTSSNTLAVPLLAKLTWRPGIFYLAAFTGPHFILPLGAMEVTQGGATASHDFSPTLAWTGGANAGLKFGPGLLFLDLRYTGDFKFVQSNGDAQYRRNIFSISLGYNYGLINKARRISE
jgi:hypothetical protein